MPSDTDEEPVYPDLDFERLKSASLGLAVILAETARSSTGQTVVGRAQIESLYDAISDAMLGYAWLRDEVIGEERGDSLLAQLEAGFPDDERQALATLLFEPGVKAD